MQAEGLKNLTSQVTSQVTCEVTCEVGFKNNATKTPDHQISPRSIIKFW
jgi:hypothetical protein